MTAKSGATCNVDRGIRVSGEHEIYCCGARVLITEKGVEVLTEPTVEHCPLHESIYGCKKITAEAVRKSVETKIQSFGFCCRDRSFSAEPVVAYGASEMMKVWLDRGIIDCAVVVCEGAGTVLATQGNLVQAIGARLTGIIRTSPVKEILGWIEANKGFVLDSKTARIDQVEGVRKAFAKGFKRIAVSIAGFRADAITEIRSLKVPEGGDVSVFSVCNTCVGDKQVEHISRADIVCASASRILRNKIGCNALLQVGVTIPVFALTEKGKRLMLDYLAEFGDKLVIFRSKKLPYGREAKSPKLKTGVG